MPILAMLYLSTLAVLMLVNSFYFVVLRKRVKFWAFLYELLSGALMLYMAAALWLEPLREFLGLSSVLAFVCVLGFDFYFTVWGRLEDLGLSSEELGASGTELAKSLSLIVSAPAYVMGILLSFEMLRQTFH